jgi:putative transposase
MVQYRRARTPGGTYFFTVNLSDRSASYLVTHINHLRRAFCEIRKQKPFDIIAVVVLPDHLHMVMRLPAGDSDFPGRWRAIKSKFTRALAQEGVDLVRNNKGGYNLWQRRYWEHQIRDETDLQRHVDYIHINPVKHGHAKRVSEWPYSSFHSYVRAGILTPDWGGAIMEKGGSFGE